MQYEAVIGLEVHAQLNTKSKIFCSCSTTFGQEPNSNLCPICAGYPGVLPVLNEQVLRKSIMTGLALNCKIASFSRFARKNYFYPDLPKNFQVSQYELPICYDGHIVIQTENGPKRIGITRAHMEEDAGKLIHSGYGYSQVDLNRTGVPLLEIVSEPDIRTPDEAKEYMQMLCTILKYLDVCDGNMEEGSLRCDANVSIRPVGQKEFGTKAEVKNINSFNFVKKALEYEIQRQIELIEDGGKVVQETRLFDSNRNVTESMRSKEQAHDYRYFPEPDLVPIEVSEEYIEDIRKTLPELPTARCERFVKEYAIPEYDAQILTVTRPTADYYEEAVKLHNNPKAISNWIMAELLRECSGKERAVSDFPLQTKQLAELVKLIDNQTISGKIAKNVFTDILRTDIMPEAYVKEKGLVQITDTAAIETMIDGVIAANPNAVAEYKGGKEGAINSLVGQAMKASKGKANPQIVRELLLKKLAQ